MKEVQSNNVELADEGLLVTTLLIKPLPVGGPRQDGTVLRRATVWLSGPAVGCVPVLVSDAQASLVHPNALRHHVVDSQPHLLVWAEALTDVVTELVVLVGGCGCSEDATQVAAVLNGIVVVFFLRVSQVTLAVDLYAFQTD